MTKENVVAMGWLPVAACPKVQRELYLSRAIRRRDDIPLSVETLSVKWEDMEVVFAEASGNSAAQVRVDEKISLVVFGRRIESLLDCAGTSAGESAQQWVLKLCLAAEAYGGPEGCVRALCDKVVERSPDGVTVGVMKLKRRSVSRGHASVRIDPATDAVQIVMRHPTAEGLKALWKSVLWRLKPQYPRTGMLTEDRKAASNSGVVVLVPPSIQISAAAYQWQQGAELASWYGVAVDVEHAKKNGIDVHVPIPTTPEEHLSSYHSCYVVRLRLRMIPPGKPACVSISGDGEVGLAVRSYSELKAGAAALGAWLGIDWTQCAPVPATGLVVKTPQTKAQGGGYGGSRKRRGGSY